MEACLLEALDLDPTSALEDRTQETALLFLHQVENGGVVESIPTIEQQDLEDGITLVAYEFWIEKNSILKGYPQY